MTGGNSMASITSSSGISSMLGQYSGIGTTQIEALLQGDAIPKTRAENKITTINAQKTAWSDVKTRLNNFLTKIENLQKPETYQTKKVTSSDEKVAKITGSADALEGNYKIKVSQLATATNIIGNKVTDSKSALGKTGELVLTTGDKDSEGNHLSFKINVDAGDSLNDVMKKINDETKNSGISAIVMDNHLVLTDSKTGNRTLQVSGDVADDLGIGSGATLNQGVDAQFNINGIDMTRSNNKIDDVVDGVTFELTGTSEKEVDLSLKNDTEKMKETIKDFVSQYNSLMSFINDSVNVGDPSATGNKSGALAGDSSLVRLQTELRNLIAPTAINGVTTKTATLGISISDRQGTLSFDEKKFDEILKNDPNSIKDFFYQSEKVADADKPKEVGYTVALKELADKYLVDKTSEKGIIATKFASFESSIKDLNKQITRIDDILEQKKARYVDMFTRLDQAMMQAEEQMSWLVSQVSAFDTGSK